MNVREWAMALLGSDVGVRAVAATALQLGIACGVGLMLAMQRHVAQTDDAIRVQRPVKA